MFGGNFFRQLRIASAVVVAVFLATTFSGIQSAQASDSKISSFSAALDSSTVSATGVTATLSFTTNTSLAPDTDIAVVLNGSSAFNFSSTTSSSFTSTTLTGIGSKSSSNGSTVFLFHLTSSAAAGAHVLKLADLINPSSSTTGTFNISTTGITGLSTGSTATVTVGSNGGSNDSHSGGSNESQSQSVTGNNIVTITAQDGSGTKIASLPVFAYCGQSNGSGTTNSLGLATISSLTSGNCGVGIGSAAGYYADQVNFTFNSSDSAQTKAVTLTVTKLDTTLALTVKNSSGAAAASVKLNLTSSDGKKFYSQTGSDGTLNLSVNYGTYTVTGYIQDSTQYFPSTSITVSSSDATHTATIQLQAYTSFIKGKVTNAAGTALSTPQIVAFSPAGMNFLQGNSDGTYTVGVQPGTYSIKAESTGYANGSLSNIVVADGATVSDQNFALTTAGNTLNVTAIDTSGATLSTVYGSVFCKDPNAAFDPSTVYFKQLSSGTASFKLPDGSFKCEMFTSGYVVTSNSTVTLSGSSTTTDNITLQKYNSTLTVQLKDQDGNSVSGVRFGVFGSSSEGYSLTGYSDSGSVSLGAIATTYTVRVYIMSGAYTANYNAPVSVTLTAGGTATSTVTVYATNATISGKVTGSDGTASSAALVTAKQQTTDGSRGFEFTATTGTDGSYTLTTVPGTYVVSAAKEGSTDLPSVRTTVTATASSTTTQNLALQATAGTLKITPVISTSTSSVKATVDSGNCYAYDGKGSYVTAAVSSGVASLAVPAGTETYGCRIVSGSTVYTTLTEGSVTVTTGATLSETVTVVSDSTNYQNALFQFSATADTTLTMPDGKTIFVPANSLDTTGNVSITASVDTSAPVDDQAYPIAPISLIARDSNNQIITSQFAGDLTVTIPYTDDQLKNYGLTESDLKGDTYSKGGWANTSRGYTVDTTNNTISITASHFSSFGVVGIKSIASTTTPTPTPTPTAPKKPAHLGLKKLKKHSVVLTWKEKKGETVTSYTVQVRKYNVKKKKKWTTYTLVLTKKEALTKLKAHTRYQFRVKACDETACSIYSKWKTFRTL